MNAPFPAYRGDEPYIFVCYAREDHEVVYTQIDWLRQQGFNIWYDEGIGSGKPWRDEVANALDDAHLLLYFLTPASAASMHCQREVHYGMDQDKPLVSVELAPTELSGGLRLAIGSIQAIQPFRMDRGRYEARLIETLRAHVRHTSRFIKDLTILVSDLRGFRQFTRTHELAHVERLLTHYESLAVTVTEASGGVIRTAEGDSLVLTFQDTDRALAAVTRFVGQWDGFLAETGFSCPVRVGMNRGSLQSFRSFLLGGSLDIAGGLCDLGRSSPLSDSSVLVTDRVRGAANDTWCFAARPPESFYAGGTRTDAANRLLHRDLLEKIPVWQLLVPDT